MWQARSTPFGPDMPPMRVGDPDTVTRMIEDAARHVPFREVFLLFGQGVLDRDKCLTTLELFAEKVSPRFRE
jgi:alkanesulfonate monooxygenase SsuD/methylene tetrahydromethanopterin reductase-like flavin-dependent oxidoreductase (luciferase family)